MNHSLINELNETDAISVFFDEATESRISEVQTVG